MKILTGDSIREADRRTMENEPVDSLELMERAAEALAQAVAQTTDPCRDILVVAGKGNNGGDGLAMARMLAGAGFRCRVALPFAAEELSEDCRANLERLPDSVPVTRGCEPETEDDTIIIDALLGSGVRGDVPGAAAEAIETINRSGCEVVSVDLPSGMKTEFGNDPARIVHADRTLTIEFPKLAMLLPEAGECCGRVEVVGIGLDREYIESVGSGFEYVDAEFIGRFRSPRPKFSHKGDYGHSLLVCGAPGMAGAATLATNAALRSGCGLVTAHIPHSLAHTLQINTPSAMTSEDPGETFSQSPAALEKYTVCGVGCGLGQGRETAAALARLMEGFARPMVLDADALNLIAADEGLRRLVPAGSLLTPHPGELCRLTGEWRDDEHKIQLLRELASQLRSTVMLKGAYTMTCLPGGEIYVNSTGTPAMAKGGSGDVLTGLVTGLAARGYAMHEAALLGAYVHGLAGEKAEAYFGTEAMNSLDIIDFLGEAFSEV